MGTAALGQFAHIGKSVSIKGELSGSEDIYIDGQVEGSVQLGEGNLTVGPNGRVHAGDCDGQQSSTGLGSGCRRSFHEHFGNGLGM